MTQAIGTVFIDAILGGLLGELGLPETLPLVKLSPRMQRRGRVPATGRDVTRDIRSVG